MKHIYILFFFTFCCFLLSFLFWEETRIFSKFQVLYATGSYEEAQNVFKNQIFFSAIDLHNLGNTSYKQSLEVTNPLGKLQESLLYYSGSLQKSQHPNTLYNYKLVENRIKSIQADQKTGADQGDDNKVTQEKKTASGTTLDGVEKTVGSGNIGDFVPQNTRADQYLLEEDDILTPLSSEETQVLESTIQYLQDEQKENQRYFGKPQNGLSEFDTAFENLMGGSEEKDW